MTPSNPSDETPASPFTLIQTKTYHFPAGITGATIECWGPGARGVGTLGGGTIGGNGGGGGGYAKGYVTVIPGKAYQFRVGVGENPTDFYGEDDYVLADHGLGTNGGGGHGNMVVYTGGNGYITTVTNGGGGGESACTSSNGNSATSNLGASGCDGGNGVMVELQYLVQENMVLLQVEAVEEDTLGKI